MGWNTAVSAQTQNVWYFQLHERFLKSLSDFLTNFESLGWKFCNVGVSKKDNDDFTYWIFKKPVSKEEYFDIVNNAIEK